jgi:hypothetical protein
VTAYKYLKLILLGDNFTLMCSKDGRWRGMDNLIIKSLEEFVNNANMLLNHSIVSAYCFGSAIYENFHSGYSDLDFFIIIENIISEDDFQKFSS